MMDASNSESDVTIEVESDDPQIKSEMGKAINKALKAKVALEYAVSESLDAASEFGFALGALDVKEEFVEKLREEQEKTKLGFIQYKRLSELLGIDI
jgi:hypothetical protein